MFIPFYHLVGHVYKYIYFLYVMDGGHINKSDSPFLFPKVPKVFPSSVFIGFINVI